MYPLFAHGVAAIVFMSGNFMVLFVAQRRRDRLGCLRLYAVVPLSLFVYCINNLFKHAIHEQPDSEAAAVCRSAMRVDIYPITKAADGCNRR